MQNGVWSDTQAVAEYQEKVSPESFRTLLLCAGRERSKHNYGPALTYIERSLAILPENDDAYFLRGQIEIDLNRNDNAEVSLRKALEINGNYLPALNLYGRLLLNSNRLDQANKMADTILSLNRNNPDGLIIKLAIELKANNLSNAKAIVERLKQMHFESDDFKALSARIESL